MMVPSLSEDPSTISPPFSLKGLKETLLSPINYYEKFANSNGTAIEALESALRSVSYILPGRFKDSEFVSEILFSLLNLFRHYNDLLLSNSSRSMNLNQRNMLNYLNYLKSRHPLMKSLMTLLNLIRIVQIPLEMVVAKLAAKRKELFVLVLELTKFVIKLGVWQGSAWRPLPRQFSLSIDRKEEAVDDKSTKSKLEEMEMKMDKLDAQLKESRSKEPLHAYLKGHKSNVYTNKPQLSFQPCSDWTSWTRELAHLARPSLYALSLVIVSRDLSKSRSKLNWVPLLVSLSLDLYSKWPELNNNTISTSPLESEERSRRLIDLLYYPLREPLYTAATSGLLDSVEERLSRVSILSPVVETLKVYRKMWENVYFYTSAS